MKKEIIIVVAFLLFSVVLVKAQGSVNKNLIIPASPLVRNFTYNDGTSGNVDTPSIWIAPNPDDSLLFVTHKTGNKVNVWNLKTNSVVKILTGFNNPNAVAVDQAEGAVYVSDRYNNLIKKYFISDILNNNLAPALSFGGGFSQSREPMGLAIYHTDSGTSIIYATYIGSATRHVRAFRADGTLYANWSMGNAVLEAIEADDDNNLIYIADEGLSLVWVYTPGGALVTSFGSVNANIHGNITTQTEGIDIYECNDDGYIIVSDQQVSEFEIFDRKTYANLGRFSISGVTDTDGIVITQASLVNYPKGGFFAQDADREVAGLDWNKLASATGMTICMDGILGGCTPSCAGKCAGDDGCSGICPNPCNPATQTCSSGICTTRYKCSGANCVADATGEYTTSNCDNSCVGGAVCSNGIVETGEICDGANLSGMNCSDLGFSGGTLKCASDCKSFDISSCTDVAEGTCESQGGMVCADGKICDSAYIPATDTSMCCPPGGDCQVVSPHAYFDALVARPEHWKSYSLRNNTLLEAYRVSQDFESYESYITYDPENDNDTRRQDAAKVFIPVDRNDIPLHAQVHLPLNTTDGYAYLFTWDVWFGDETRREISGLSNWKTFQFDAPRFSGANPGIWFEIQTNFNLAPIPSDIALFGLRGYGTAGPNVENMEKVLPRVGNFTIKPETWTRYWVLIEQKAYDWDNISVWVADENNEPVQIIDKLEFENFGELEKGGIELFRLEYDTSLDIVKPGKPSMVSYVRNFVVLRDLANPVDYMQKPSVSVPDFPSINCSDGKKNQNETGVDCGGVCVNEGKKCGNGNSCNMNGDCVSNNCVGSVCTALGNAPAAPSNLIVSLIDGIVNLFWQDNSGNEKEFIIQRSADGVTWDNIATLPANTKTYEDSEIAFSPIEGIIDIFNNLFKKIQRIL